MVFLWILGAILLLLGFLLFVGFKIHISYKDELALAVSVLGLRVRLLPKRKKKVSLRKFTHKRQQKRLMREAKDTEKKKRRQILKENRKKRKAASVAQKKPASDGTADGKEPSIISLLLSVVGEVLDTFFGTLGVEVAYIRIKVGGPDAATTAITYGAVAQGVAYLLELLSGRTRFRRRKKKYVSLTVDYLSSKTTFDVSLVFTFRLWNFLRITFVILKKMIKEKISRVSAQT